MDEHEDVSEKQRRAVTLGFSRKAMIYDAFAYGHPNLERMRRKVRDHILRYLGPEDRMLEINAGTGEDACFFARMGFRVHATDISAAMVKRMEMKAKAKVLGSRMSVQLCDYNALERLGAGPFDYVYSNMGGVNCTGDLERTARSTASVLSPGGRVTWVVMPKVCLWELAAGLRGDFQTAARRRAKDGVIANVEGVKFRTWYYTPQQVTDAFGDEYHMICLEGLSVFTPPADYKEFPHKHPRLYGFLCGLDDRLSNRNPFTRWGDFFILTLGRRR